MTKILKLLSLSAVLLLLTTSCTSVKIEDYADTTPALDLKTFFQGKLKVYGMLQDFSGTVTRRFTADIDASWQGNKGVLDEVFYFDDGERQTRIWQLTDHGDGRYSGTAGDVIGEAYGIARGFAFRWQYELAIPYQGDTLNVKLDDWLYLISDDRLINRTSLYKFGIEVGQLTLIIEQLD